MKAGPVALSIDQTAAQAFRAIAEACVRQFRLNEARLLVVRDAEALHQCRVALRRLRSAFSIFNPMIAGSTCTALRQDLRWLVSELGNARNLDVLLERSRHGILHDRIETARTTAYDRVEAALHSLRARSLMLDLVEWAASGDWLGAPDTEDLRNQPAREFAIRSLDRLRRKVKRGGRDLARLDDEARHGVRKDAKKLRYAAEFFAGLFPGKQEVRRWKKFMAALEPLQDNLGALNDLVSAPQVIGQLGLAAGPGILALLGKGRKSALLEAAVAAHDELIDTRRYWR